MQTGVPPLIGRVQEIAGLARALDNAGRGHGLGVFIAGEAGIGKSRLARHAAGLAFERGMRVLRGRGTPIGPMVPFRPVAEALLSLVRGGDLPADAALGPYRQVLGRLIPEWADLRQTTESLVVLAEAVLRLLTLVGRSQPCLVVLEDLHEADAETLAVVEYLVDNLADQPVMVIATIRSDPGNALEVARRAARHETGVLLELEPLSRAEVALFATRLLDADDVPAAVVERLWQDSAGNPFVVEEMLHGMVAGGLLVSGPHGWHVDGALRVEVPAAVVRSIVARADRLGPQGRELLSVAAVLGHRFPLNVVRAVTTMDDGELLRHLHAGVAARLVMPGEPAPDWYAFRHPLTAEALRTGLAAPERADLSRRAAAAITALYPDLPGDWCPMVAALLTDAGATEQAGTLFAEAGRRALHAGAAESAVWLLDRAHQLATSAEARADALDALLPALSEAGHFERALRLGESIAELTTLPATRRASLHARAARVACLAGRWTDCGVQIREARALLGPDAADEHTAPVDVIDAYLNLNTPAPDRVTAAAALARRAADSADRAGVAVVACEAWQLLGVIAREDDLGEADRCFSHALALADRANIPIQRIYALVRAAGNDWLRLGSTDSLDCARAEALRVGAIMLAYNVDAIVVLQSVLCGEYAAAARQLEPLSNAVTQLRLGSLVGYVLMTEAVMHAHQGRRHDMEVAITALVEQSRSGPPELPLCLGLARAFCALLEEDRDLADTELAKAAAYEAENPTTFHLSGKHGLALLLAVLAGRAGTPHITESASPSTMRWNQQFVLLAQAVLLGRDGQVERAEATCAAALRAAAPYPLARHLGLRLVADEAHAAGWGSPIPWLRAADDYFHGAGITAVASACRAKLRRLGAAVPQRRTGNEQVPRALRVAGVTVREYEVLVLLAERLSNKAIAARLHISPRTVEKHVASLITKTGSDDRVALTAHLPRE
ncbi:LuxR family transcriptional regulator [Actinokineospora inagensis]|uniref:LuxR family transcriptional regulator n=1 Tax=Actinokineospora inagensis TaxID=103730 RepID=UPI0004265FD6|nr:LuxR family transcriptional regulator [Actinokineospora inagensis]